MLLRLLVVDDSSLMRRMVIRSINISGLPVGEVYQAENGRDALDLLTREWVDIILADVHMPTMSGIEMMEHMANDVLLCSVPVVIVSTERSEARIEYLKKLGVKAYLNKPFLPETLARTVREVLGLEHAS